MSDPSKDKDEAKLERLAKRLLDTPPEPREKAAERGKRKRQSASESEKGKGQRADGLSRPRRPREDRG